jgi:hypothetical protein
MARSHDVYLSSTLRDLVDEREAVEQVLVKQGYGVKQSYSAGICTPTSKAPAKRASVRPASCC